MNTNKSSHQDVIHLLTRDNAYEVLYPLKLAKDLPIAPMYMGLENYFPHDNVLEGQSIDEYKTVHMMDFLMYDPMYATLRTNIYTELTPYPFQLDDTMYIYSNQQLCMIYENKETIGYDTAENLEKLVNNEAEGKIVPTLYGLFVGAEELILNNKEKSLYLGFIVMKKYLDEMEIFDTLPFDIFPKKYSKIIKQSTHSRYSYFSFNY